MDGPSGVAVDLDHIYIVDNGNHRVVVYAKHNGAFLFQLGQGTAADRGDTPFYCPWSVSVDSEAGVVFVADHSNLRVCVYRSCDGSYIRHFQVLQEDDTPDAPLAVLWHAATGALYVTRYNSTSMCVYQC
eukprot:TRINITY_DN8100_c0_g1_i9.p1 TRINITY_DN8100_c0_g1~~TRINITY_DN8100_c0_g1_i9.p1  ORF type:complete len:144 (-),score=20.15 TRINITY_DN8100_c0_g1_i9:27-416(-)